MSRLVWAAWWPLRTASVRWLWFPWCLWCWLDARIQRRGRLAAHREALACGSGRCRNSTEAAYVASYLSKAPGR